MLIMDLLLLVVLLVTVMAVGAVGYLATVVLVSERRYRASLPRDNLLEDRGGEDYDNDQLGGRR